MILKLIVKDFRANAAYTISSLVILFMVSAVFISLFIIENGRADPELAFYFVIVVFSSSIVSLLYIKVDELYGMEKVFFSMPIAKKQIVIGKYGSTLTHIVFALLIHFLGTQIAAIINRVPDYPHLGITRYPMFWFWLLLIIICFKSFAYPFFFKFGLARGSLVYGLIQFTLIVLMVLGHKLYALFKNLDTVVVWVSNQNLLITILVCASFVLGLMAFSIKLSIHFYNQKTL